MIGIITDSTCDIPENLIEQYGISVIPQVIVWGDQVLRDRVDLNTVDFYQRLKKDPLLPKSSIPTPGEITLAYEEAIRRGADELIMLTISSAMSAMFSAAKTAAEAVKVPVHVVDARGPTMSLGWQVLAAARAKEAGADVDSILEQVNRVRERLVQLVAMVSLEYLQRGGRIGGAVKWVGTLLSIKPLVSINHQTGLVEPLALARTQKDLQWLLYHRFFERLKGKGNLHIAVLHGDAAEQADELARRIQAEYQPVELLVNMTGPVLGNNTGPGALALCGYAEDWV